jgi:hypothetical protein
MLWIYALDFFRYSENIYVITKMHDFETSVNRKMLNTGA